MVNNKKKVHPIDVRNDFEMVSEGIRVRVAIPRNSSIWTKTS